MTVAPSARMKELLREFVDEMETEFVKTGSLAGVRAALAELLHVEARLTRAAGKSAVIIAGVA